MSEGEGGKKVGVFGALIAGLGMLLAKGADDCARLGATTARGAAPLVDDAARVSAHGAGIADDGFRAAGPGAGFADEAALGNGSRFAAGAGDDALGAAARSGDDWLGESLDVTTELVSMVDFDGGSGADDAEPARPAGLERALKRQLVTDPRAIAVVPSTAAAYKRMFGVAPQGGELREMSLVFSLLEQPAKDIGMKELAAMLAQHRGSNPVTILGYTDGLMLALPSGERVSDADVHEACMNVGMNCIVLACDEKVPADGEPCVRSMYFTWSIRASQARSGKPAMSLGRFARSLTLPPPAHEGPPMILSRVARSPDGELKLLRTRPKSSRGAP